MKKLGIMCFVMAAMTAMCVTSCSKDNDDNKKGGNGQSNLEQPAFKEQACTITPGNAIGLSNGDNINSIDLSESGKVYLETENAQGEKTILNGSYTYSDNIYNCSGTNFVGTIEMENTRASQSLRVKINFSIISENGDTAKSNVQDFVEAVKEVGAVSGDADIISTWAVRGLTVDIVNKNDPNDGVFKSFPDGNFNALVKEAEDQGANISPEDKAELNKTLKTVTFRAGKLTFDYDNGKSDAATWKWVNAKTCDEITVSLETGMGNKFLVDDPAVSVEFNKAKKYMNITLDAELAGNSKDIQVSLTIQLIQQANVN